MNGEHSSAPPAGYEEAMTELQAIVDALQNGQVGIDELTGYTRRANELIAWCRERLRQVEEDLESDAPRGGPDETNA